LKRITDESSVLDLVKNKVPFIVLFPEFREANVFVGTNTSIYCSSE
jgi:hypothetical protein